MFLCGLLCGCLNAVLQGHYLLAGRLPADCDRQLATLGGRVVSLPVTARSATGELRQQFLFRPDVVTPQRCAGPRRVRLTQYGGETVVPDRYYRLSVRLRTASGPVNPVGFDREALYAREDIGALGSVREVVAMPTDDSARHSFSGYQSIRFALRQRIDALPLSVDARAVLRALTLGDQGAIDDRLWQLCRQLGIGHLLVISGLHIGLVAGAGFGCGALLVRLLPGLHFPRPWLPVLAALAPAVFYALLAGLTLPTRRALLMLCAFCLTLLLARRADTATSLLLAAVIVLACDPLAVLGSGFWLSFGAVACLLWLANWQRGSGRLRGAGATHLGMSLIMLPLTAWFFGGGSLVSALANFLLIPVVGLYAVPLCLLAALAFNCGVPLDGMLWRAVGRPIDASLPELMLLSDSAAGWVYRLFYPGLAGTLLGLGGAVLLLAPLGWRARCLALVLLLPLLLPARDTGTREPRPRVAVLDVGQGTAVLLDDGQRALLYDTGGGIPGAFTVAEALVLPYLRSRGIGALDTFVVSHGDLDHSAGAGAVLDTLPVARFRHGVPGAFAGRGRRCRAGEAWQWPGGTRFQFLSPAREEQLSSNNGSCVLQVIHGRWRLLLVGDIDTDRERELVRYWRSRLGSDWLLVAHHGSASSSAASLLKWVDAEFAVVSAAAGNRFGHPHPAVVQRLLHAGAAVESTAQAGAVLFEFRDRGTNVQRWREAAPRYWRWHPGGRQG